MLHPMRNIACLVCGSRQVNNCKLGKGTAKMTDGRLRR